MAYAVSGVLGIGAALCLMIGWTGVGLLLVALLLAVAVIIEYIKDNKMQEWLKRCVWGNLRNERFKSLDQELEQLKVAAAG